VSEVLLWWSSPIIILKLKGNNLTDQGGGGKGAFERAVALFRRQFGGEPAGVAVAPGRVNLIGEHTDYNGGFVLPMAVDRHTAVAFRAEGSSKAVVASADYGETVEFDVVAPERESGHHWSNYVRGVASVLSQAGYRVSGLAAAVAGDVPQGAGLSSSAAIEVATLLAMDAASGLGIPPIEQVKLAQRAENRFVGVGCGIMDQFVSRMGERDSCLLIDCRDLSYRAVPLRSSDVRVVAMDTAVARRLSSGEYMKRRSACERASAKLVGKEGALLRDVTLTQLLASKDALTDEEYRRALHVLRENARVGHFCEAVASGRYEAAGRLMADSHESLRDLYEVSSRELDEMVAIASGVEGVYGARLTGAGFGGCAVALVRSGAESDLCEAVEREYPSRTGLTPRTFVFEPSQGARVEWL
jgi:galactokinase